MGYMFDVVVVDRIIMFVVFCEDLRMRRLLRSELED